MQIGMKKQQIIILILCGIVLILLWRGCNQRSSLKEQLELYSASQDTLTKTRNKLGQEETQVALLTSTRKKDLLKLKTNNASIKHLQAVVNDYRGKLRTATVLSTSTGVKGSTDTKISRIDTVYADGEVMLFPVYESRWDGKWSKGFIIATKDSIRRSIFVRNEFEITQGLKKQKGLFKPKKPVVSVLNLNPNTETKEIRSFDVKVKNKRIGVGVGATYGLSLPTLKPALVVGVSVQYNLIKF